MRHSDCHNIQYIIFMLMILCVQLHRKLGLCSSLVYVIFFLRIAYWL
jgi:hypothetical protein